MLALNQVSVSPLMVLNELKKDILPVIDLGDFVKRIKTDLEVSGVDLDAASKIKLDELYSMSPEELREKIVL